MKEYIFDEQKDIESMIEHNFVDADNPCRTIKKLARYNYYVLGLNGKDSYDKIDEYMRKNCTDYTEVGYYKSIQGCIKDADKSRWKNICQVVITQQELDIIKSLNDDRKEKIAFVLLADAKYDNAYKGQVLNLSYLSIGDIYKLSRVTMPTKDRAIFLHFLYNNGLVDINLNPVSVNRKLNYVFDNSDTGIILSESNYKELAFTYMNWKYGGYRECKGCGALIKAKKNTRYCKLCATRHQSLEYKTIQCVDCGTDVVVKSKNSKSCRCENCQRIKNNTIKREYWAKTHNG